MIGPTASYWQDLMGTTNFLPGVSGAPQGFRISRCANSPLRKQGPGRGRLRSVLRIRLQ